MSRLNAHEIQIPYDNHHKVSSSVKSYQNTHNSVKSINNSRQWGENMLEYLSANIICSEKRTVFREHNSRKTVSFKEQIMSKDKYPSIFSPQLEAIVFIRLKIFVAMHTVLKIREYSHWDIPQF